MKFTKFTEKEALDNFKHLLDPSEANSFKFDEVESITIVEMQNHTEESSTFTTNSDFPRPSGGSIGRKTTENQSSSKTRINDSALKLPRIEDKTGNIGYIKGFLLAKCQVYWQFSAGGRYNKLAFRILVSNETYDRLDLQGLQQYMYLSATGSNVSHMSMMKLGSTYQMYSLKFYKISDTIKIANWKNGAYVNEVPDLKPESADFRSVENFGSGSTIAGVVVDICISSYCNCAALIGPSNNDDGCISPCPKCKSTGMLVLENGVEVLRDGGAGLITLVNIVTHEGELPVQMIVHPNFTTSKLSDLVLDVGSSVEVVGSRMLNSRNLMLVFEITGFECAKDSSSMELLKKDENKKEDGLEDVKMEEFKAEL